MNIKINGKETAFNDAELTVEKLLLNTKVPNVEMVTVQLNGSFVPKEQFGSTQLSENDELDFLYFMGGGAI